MAVTYESIASTTLGSNQSSVTFSSISSAYTDIVLIMQVRETTNQQGYVRLNSDTGTNYSRTYMYGTGSSLGSGRIANQTGINTAMGDTYDMNIMHFMNYSNTSTYKTVLERSGDNNAVAATVYLWRNTSAINSITIASLDGSSSLASGSTFALYGIKSN